MSKAQPRGMATSAVSRSALRVVSLFAGIGGFDLAAERAGMEVVAHVEKDASCQRLLAR
jgi:DNA (cytosine-5)-methyltransferase 1